MQNPFSLAERTSHVQNLHVNYIVERAISRLYLPTAPEALILLRDLRAETGSMGALAGWLGIGERTIKYWLSRGVSREGRVIVWFAWSLAFCPENLVALLARMPRRCRPRSERSSQGAGARATGN